jgi:hypothetical protein
MENIRLLEARENKVPWKKWGYILFYEYFQGYNGAGPDANHQAVWTGVIAKVIELFRILDAKQGLESGKQSGYQASAELSF